VPLESYPLISWDWYIEKPFEPEIDERTFQGDDHPARYYLDFKAPNGETHAMELVWGNKALKAGTGNTRNHFGDFILSRITW